jgi:hypothetical protein
MALKCRNSYGQAPRTEAADEEKDASEPRDVQLEVVRDVGGRPLFLTPKRFIRICRWIEQGESASEACRLELVTYQGFRQHVKRNPKYQRRLKEAEETREEFLREYHNCQHSEARAAELAGIFVVVRASNTFSIRFAPRKPLRRLLRSTDRR